MPGAINLVAKGETAGRSILTLYGQQNLLGDYGIILLHRSLTTAKVETNLDVAGNLRFICPDTIYTARAIVSLTITLSRYGRTSQAMRFKQEKYQRGGKKMKTVLKAIQFIWWLILWAIGVALCVLATVLFSAVVLWIQELW